jgi:hypothetical protein
VAAPVIPVEMPQVTTFGILPIFRGLQGRLSPLRIVNAVSADEAKRKAELLASVLGGAVAFAATYDPELDAWDPLTVLALCGEVPEGWETNLDLRASE